LKTLDKLYEKKGELEEHDWWKSKEGDESEDEFLLQQETATAALESPLGQIGGQAQAQDHQQHHSMPWKLVTLTSRDRDGLKESPSQYTNKVNMKGVISILLHSIDIPMTANSITLENNILYYSEDDEPMKTLELPLQNMEEGNLNLCLDYLREVSALLSKQSSKYRYNVSLNRHTNRIRITQQLESGQARNRFHLYFEQTRNNCAELLGFENKDYRDCSEYEGVHEHQLQTIDKKVHMLIEELSDKPLLTLKLTMGQQRKQQQFNGACVYYSQQEDTGDDIDSLTVSFVDDSGKVINLGGDDNIITFKYYYIPMSPIGTRMRQSEPPKTPDVWLNTIELNTIDKIVIPRLESEENYPVNKEKWKSPIISDMQQQEFTGPSIVQSNPSADTPNQVGNTSMTNFTMKKKMRLPTLDI